MTTPQPRRPGIHDSEQGHGKPEFIPDVGSVWHIRGGRFTVASDPVWSPHLRLWFVHGQINTDGRSRPRKSVCHCVDFARMFEVAP